MSRINLILALLAAGVVTAAAQQTFDPGHNDIDLGAVLAGPCGSPLRSHPANAGAAPICVQADRYLSPPECEQRGIVCEYMGSFSFGACVRVSRVGDPYALRYVCQGKST